MKRRTRNFAKRQLTWMRKLPGVEITDVTGRAPDGRRRGPPSVASEAWARSSTRIDDKLAAWIGRQQMFFVGTAPSGDGGHVNVSPKGPIESLRILDPHAVAYQDVIGSGAETIAHLRDNGRIVVMLCAFEGPPRILRLHGRGTVLPADGRRRSPDRRRRPAPNAP